VAVGQQPFLKAFLTSPAYEDDRELILVNFQSLVRPYENERSELKAFQKQQAELRRAKIAKMTSPPMSMKLWLDDVHGSVKIFRDHKYIRTGTHSRTRPHSALQKKNAVFVLNFFLEFLQPHPFCVFIFF